MSNVGAVRGTYKVKSPGLGDGLDVEDEKAVCEETLRGF